MSDDELDPGLQGYSDSGSDFHDLPEPTLPKGLRKTCLDASDGGGITLKRPKSGDGVLLRCRPCPAALEHLLNEQGLLSFTVDATVVSSLPWLSAAAKTLRLSERARFQGSLVEVLDPAGLELTLVDWIVRCDLFEDGSAIKSVLRRPDDRRRPVIGQRCQVALSLPVLSWSVESLEYEICDIVPSESAHRWQRQQRPPEGWTLLDKALLSMRRGERCSLQCSDARLHQGATIPLPEGTEGGTAGAGWQVTLELQEFLETLDVSFEKDGSVLKRSIHQRDANVRCQALGRCRLRLDWGFHGPTKLETCETLGSGAWCDAVEAAVLQMREHEVAEVTTDFHLCDEVFAQTALQPGAMDKVTFRLEVQEYVPGEWEKAASDEDKLQALTGRKEEAVKLVKMGRWRLAAFHFRDIYELLGYIDDFRGLQSTTRVERVKDLKESCLLNRALCLIKVKEFKAALHACDLLLESASHESETLRTNKAWLRRAQANLGLDECVAALKDCQRLQGTPLESEAQRLETEVRRRQKALDAEAKDLYDKMCRGLGRLPHPLDVD